MLSLKEVGVDTGLACFLLLIFSGDASGSSYCWNHQQETYNATFKAATCSGTCTVTPFFSPGTSLQTYVSLIDAAQESIDVYTPSMKSWTEACTKDTDCPKKGSCTGCPIDEMKINETFPIFPALLNAVHERGVKIRIITNNFTFAACENRVIPFDWLALNKIEIRMYATTTFQHTKYISIDKGKKTAVSSVNWSHTSFTKNREAGVILEDCTCSAVSLYSSVFDYDWDTAIEYVISRAYTESEIERITDAAHMAYPLIANNSAHDVFITELIPHNDVKVKKVYVSPDSARDTLLDYLDNVKKSLNLAIYQVTDDGLCSKLLQMHKKGINVTLLVSHTVIPGYNSHKANECYSNLTAGGMEGHIQRSSTNFRFSHEKYWITDRTTVHLSTGNWSPSDFPMGSSWEPYRKSRHSVNRDLEIALEHPALEDYFYKVFNNDWHIGTEWRPSPRD